MHQTQIQNGLNTGLTLISAGLSLTYLVSIEIDVEEITESDQFLQFFPIT